MTVILWFLEKNFYGQEIRTSQTFRYLGQISGFLAIIFLSLNYILATRVKIIEAIVGGLDKLYRVHMYTGIIAFIFILSHPIFLALQTISNDEFFRSYFIPYYSNSFGQNLGIAGFWLFTILMLFASNQKVAYYIWKLVHSFIGIPLLLISVHTLLAGSNNEYLPLEAWYLFWAFLGLASFIYKVFLYDFIGPVYKYEVINIKKTAELFEVFLKPIGKKLEFKAGQFSFIQFTNSKVFMEPHPYTMSSDPKSDNLKFSIKKLGDWSSSLNKLEIGDIAKVAGPYGHFHSDHLRESKKQVWIGGGIGVTPFLSKAIEEQYKKTCDKIYLIYSDNTEKQAVFKEEIKSYGEDNDHLHTIQHISDKQGFLNANQIEEWIEGVDDTVFLICGPKPMRDSLYKGLAAKGVKDKDIVFELFNFK